MRNKARHVEVGKACTDLLTQTGRIVKENEEMRRKMLDLEKKMAQMTQNGMAENGEMRRIMSDLEKTQMKTQME